MEGFSPALFAKPHKAIREAFNQIDMAKTVGVSRSFNERPEAKIFYDIAVKQGRRVRFVYSGHWATEGYWVEFPPYSQLDKKDFIIEQNPKFT